MDKTLFIVGFSLVMGVWNMWAFRRQRNWWFWSGLALIVFAIVVLVLEKAMGIAVFYQV